MSGERDRLGALRSDEPRMEEAVHEYEQLMLELAEPV